jgi:hypothetical protein
MIYLRPDVAKDISAQGLARIDGPAGTFYLKNTAFQPEAGFCFFYGDENHQFFFYVNVSSKRDGTALDVHNATTGRLKGNTPQVTKPDVDKIERNIRYALRGRKFAAPDELIDKAHIPTEVTFTWSLSQ